MDFLPGELYHIYNQGNNKQTIFFKEDNYRFFLNKIRKFILPFCDLLAFSLMPTYFDLMVHANKNSIRKIKCGSVKMNILSNGFRILESSYAQAINKQEKRSGSLFQHNTRATLLGNKAAPDNGKVSQIHDPLTCFNCIHQNPMISGLVVKMEDWQFSSFAEYIGTNTENLCNKKLASQLLNISPETLHRESYLVPEYDEMKSLI